MNVYIVQVANWGWDNTAVYDTKEKAIDFCLSYCIDRNVDMAEDEIIEELNEYGYIDGFIAIEEWEVE